MPARRNAMFGGINRWEGGAMINSDADDALSGLAPLLRQLPRVERG
jgi:hypothetical protein